MKRAALLVIDVQESFLHRPFWSEADLPRYQQNQLDLIAGCQALGVPVIDILHESGVDGPFSAASGLVRRQAWLKHQPAATFTKHVHNAITDSGLDQWLHRHGIQKLIISGIRTEQCCETTTRVASDLGYEVDFVSAATLTFDMTHEGSGRLHTAAEIRERTELVLAGRFARIATVEQALEALRV